MSVSDPKDHFFELDAQRVIESVEEAMQKEWPKAEANGHVLALNSLENRVYQVGFHDHPDVVAKFYRPGRWSEDQILDEHEFIDRLDAMEVPVIAPFSLAEGKNLSIHESDTLAQTSEDIFLAVYPKGGGRLRDELDDQSLRTLGRYMGRMHQMTKDWTPEFRLSLLDDFYLKRPLEILADTPHLVEPTRSKYLEFAKQLLEKTERLLRKSRLILVHGDCHLGNVLWKEDAPFLLDFDDSMIAPAAQDLWMVIRERGPEADRQKNEFLEAYQQMCEFDFAELQLIEGLRALRIIYYSAWICQRWDDPSFPKAFPQYGSIPYWNSELEAFYEIAEHLH